MCDCGACTVTLGGGCVKTLRVACAAAAPAYAHMHSMQLSYACSAPGLIEIRDADKG